MLLLFSPIIEKSLENISLNRFTSYIINLSILNLFFGFFLGHLNNNGYNAFNFIYLYYIARYIKVIEPKIIISNIKLLIISLISTIMIGIFYLIINYLNIKLPNALRYFAYNNPLVIITSISIFIIFTRLNIKSFLVRNIAKYSLFVYILCSNQCTSFIREYGYKIFVSDLSFPYNIFSLIIYAIILYIIYSFIGFLFSKPLNYILSQVSDKIKKL